MVQFIQRSNQLAKQEKEALGEDSILLIEIMPAPQPNWRRKVLVINHIQFNVIATLFIIGGRKFYVALIS